MSLSIWERLQDRAEAWRQARRSRRALSLPEAGTTLWLRAASGYGDHLMLTAVLEGLKAERPELRVILAVHHPEIFWHNPHVAALVTREQLEGPCRSLAGRFRRVVFREPSARYLQVDGHLIEDMYGCLGVPLARRPREPRLYLTPPEERVGERLLARRPRPRVAIVTHGKGSVRLPIKIFPGGQWAEVSRQLTASLPAVIQLGARREGPRVPGTLD